MSPSDSTPSNSLTSSALTAPRSVSYPRDKIGILLLEGIDPSAAQIFKDRGYQVKTEKRALSEEELLEVIPKIHILGIRSKTHVTARVLEAAQSLLSVGCFCIGTDQVDLNQAEKNGVPVFNAPFSNTRSVAELTMAEIVMLSRKAAHKSMLLHQGKWDKSAEGSYEIRQKVLGIVGYGHIGPQVGLLAESFGMQVLFYDILTKLPLGNAKAVSSLDELLQRSDFVTLHVPDTAQTKNLISKHELSLMRKGSYLLNLSRGSVVDIPALAEALRSEALAGAAVDVFPSEPKSNEDPFRSELMGLPNVILTPHIGGSTLEAQKNIGLEVGASLLKFLETGSTTSSVNFPCVELPVVHGAHRILNIHHNVPGVLKDINSIMANLNANISAQYLATQRELGYLIMDVDSAISTNVKDQIEKLETNIRTRLLY